MGFREYHRRAVRVLSLCLTCVDGPSDEVWSFRRFALGTLGPTTFALSLSESCLTIFLFNTILSLYPAYL